MHATTTRSPRLTGNSSTGRSTIVTSTLGKSTTEISLLALLLLGSTACNKLPASGGDMTAKGAANAATTESALSSTDAALAGVVDPHDPCRLLKASEVEALLGAKLAGPGFRAGAPNGDRAGLPEPGGPACWYETADFRNVAVEATWTDAGAIMAGIGGWLAKAEGATKGLIKLKDGSELTGDWDEVRMLGCCNFVALQGDSMVEIDFGGSLATPEQAGTLANAALARLSAPLPIDGNAGVGAARQRQSLRPVAGDACSLWNAEDIGAVLEGELKGAPHSSGDECTWSYDNDAGRSRTFVSNVKWRNGYRSYHEENEMFSGMTANLAKETGGKSMLRASETVDGPWDAAMDSPIQFNTVKHDVQITLRHGGITLEQRRELLRRAYARMELAAGSSS